MSYNKIAVLIKKIHEKSTNGSIEWEGTEEEGTYQVSFSNYSVRISTRFNPAYPDQSDQIIQIINSSGELVEEVSDIDLKDLIPKAYEVMKNIHELARRQVMGVEHALDSILGELDDEIAF